MKDHTKPAQTSKPYEVLNKTNAVSPKVNHIDKIPNNK